MASRKHLAQRIKSIRFCLDPWELADPTEIHVVTQDFRTPFLPWDLRDPTVGRRFSSAAALSDLDWDALYSSEQETVLELHQLDGYNTHYQPPDQGVLNLIIGNLGPSCSVDLDLRIECSQRDETELERNRCKVVSGILGGVPFPRVRKLRIFNSECNSNIFLNALRYMAPTIECVELDGVALWSDEGTEELPSDGTRWTAAFRTMLECPKLGRIELEDLREDSGLTARLVEYEGCDRSDRLQLEGNEKIRKSLMLNREHVEMIDYW